MTNTTSGAYVKETIEPGTVFSETRHGRVIRTGIRDFYGVGELIGIAKVDFGHLYGVYWVPIKNLRRSTKEDFELTAKE